MALQQLTLDADSKSEEPSCLLKLQQLDTDETLMDASALPATSLRSDLSCTTAYILPCGVIERRPKLSADHFETHVDTDDHGHNARPDLLQTPT